ncbi:MAG: hypothetical protein ACQGVK_07685 [Myxococcota bacterium]
MTSVAGTGWNARPDGPAHFGWFQSFVDLHLAPERFFGKRIPTASTLAAVWTIGAASVIDRIDTMMLRADSSIALGSLQVTDSWAALWLAVVVGGLVVGPLYWALGGWWYALRLRWCGVAGPERREAYRLNLFTNGVAAWPTLLVTLLSTLLYDSYRSASLAVGIEWIYLLAPPFWSIWVSYRAVRTGLRVDPRRARLWFAILPSLAFGSALALFFAAGVASA